MALIPTELLWNHSELSRGTVSFHQEPSKMNLPYLVLKDFRNSKAVIKLPCVSSWTDFNETGSKV